MKIKLYAHADDDTYYEKGEKLGFKGKVLRNFANWGYELEFDAEVDMETGEVKLLSIDGHKILYEEEGGAASAEERIAQLKKALEWCKTNYPSGEIFPADLDVWESAIDGAINGV